MEMQGAGSSFLNLNLCFLSLKFVSDLKISSTRLAGFPRNSKTALFLSWKRLSARMLARNPSQYCCFLPLSLFLGASYSVLFSASASQTPPVNLCTLLVLMCALSRMMVSASRPSLVIQLAGEGSRASYGFWRSPQCCSLSHYAFLKPFAPPVSNFTAPSRYRLSFFQTVNLPYALPPFPSFQPLTFVMLMRCFGGAGRAPPAGWPGGSWREMPEPTRSICLLFLLFFCFFFPIFLEIIASLDPAA